MVISLNGLPLVQKCALRSSEDTKLPIDVSMMGGMLASESCSIWDSFFLFF